MTCGRISSSWRARYGRQAVDLLGQRVAVAGRPALHDVGDVRRTWSRAMPISSQHEPVEELAAAADERAGPAGPPLARALADEQQVGVGVARAEHDLGPARRRAPQRVHVRASSATSSSAVGIGRRRLRRRPRDGVPDGAVDDVGGEAAHDPRAGVDGAGGGGHEGVAVAGGVGRVEGRGQAVVAGLGDEQAVELRRGGRWWRRRRSSCASRLG